jgi:hypothetical protein
MRKYVGHTIGLYPNLKDKDFYLVEDVEGIEQVNKENLKLIKMLRMKIVDLYYKLNEINPEMMADKTIAEVKSETH